MYFIARRFLRNGPEEQTRLYMTALFRSQYADKSSFELDGQLVNEAFVRQLRFSVSRMEC